MNSAASVDQDQIALFSSHAADWWNPDGALRPLHRLNPARLEYIRNRACSHFNRQAGSGDVFKNLSILDIGCGGGILCEPLARLGGHVTGLDASNEAIKVAKAHAKQSALSINYHASSAEDFAKLCVKQKKKFDMITALEILEHVASVDSLLSSIASLLKPEGIAFFSTLNRTPQSYLLGIVAAEHILKWVPKGTHEWRKFMRPSELAAGLAKNGMQTSDVCGVVFDPLNNNFRLSRGAVSVNYLLTAVK